MLSARFASVVIAFSLSLAPFHLAARPIGIGSIYRSVERSELVAAARVFRSAPASGAVHLDVEVLHVFQGDPAGRMLQVEVEDAEYPQIDFLPNGPITILLLASKKGAAWTLNAIPIGLLPWPQKVLVLPFDETKQLSGLQPGLDGVVDLLLASGELPADAIGRASADPRPLLEFARAGVGLQRLRGYYEARLTAESEGDRVEALVAYLLRPEWVPEKDWWEVAKGIQEPGLVDFLRWLMQELLPNQGQAQLRTLADCVRHPEMVRLRLACARRLAHSRELLALEALAPLLDDPDPLVVAAAVAGLGMFANNVAVGQTTPLPGDWPCRDHGTLQHFDMSPHENREEREYFAGFWREWWRQNSSRIAAAYAK